MVLSSYILIAHSTLLNFYSHFAAHYSLSLVSSFQSKVIARVSIAIKKSKSWEK